LSKFEFVPPVENSQEILRDTAGRADLGAATKRPLRLFGSAAPPWVLRSSAPRRWRRRVRGCLRLSYGFEHGGRELQTCGVQQVASEKALLIRVAPQNFLALPSPAGG